MSDPYKAMIDWCERTFLLSKQGKELIMTEKCKEPNYLQVAEKVTQFLKETYGENASYPEVLEGMWLAMQMVGGPAAAARTIVYCVPKVS